MVMIFIDGYYYIYTVINPGRFICQIFKAK